MPRFGTDQPRPTPRGTDMPLCPVPPTIYTRRQSLKSGPELAVDVFAPRPNQIYNAVTHSLAGNTPRGQANLVVVDVNTPVGDTRRSHSMDGVIQMATGIRVAKPRIVHRRSADDTGVPPQRQAET